MSDQASSTVICVHLEKIGLDIGDWHADAIERHLGRNCHVSFVAGKEFSILSGEKIKIFYDYVPPNAL